MSIAADWVEVLVAIEVVGKARGKVSEGPIAAKLQVILIVGEGAAVAVVEAKLAEALILKEDKCDRLCER